MMESALQLQRLFQITLLAVKGRYTKTGSSPVN